MPIITDAFLFLNSFDIAIDSIPCKKFSCVVDFDNEIIYNFFVFVGSLSSKISATISVSSQSIKNSGSCSFRETLPKCTREQMSAFLPGQ